MMPRKHRAEGTTPPAAAKPQSRRRGASTPAASTHQWPNARDGQLNPRQESEDAVLINLCAAFDALERRAQAMPGDAAGDAGVLALQEEQAPLVDRIVQLRATTAAGLRARARSLLLYEPRFGRVGTDPGGPERIVVGLKATSIYQKMAGNSFPAAVRLSPGAVGWLSSEIDGWIAERAAAERVTSIQRPRQQVPLSGRRP